MGKSKMLRKLRKGQPNFTLEESGKCPWKKIYLAGTKSETSLQDMLIGLYLIVKAVGAVGEKWGEMLET